MALKLYNTLTRGKEDFDPLDPQHIRMYVCGPTVYDYAHIGNARPVVVFDVLYRLLKHLYPDATVTYVRNITDVEDKIITASQETGEPIADLTRRTARIYQADMAALGALDPDLEPRATEHIAEMIEMIERLIEKGHAYAADGEVLFHVPSMPDYGRLSRHSRDELIAGARVDVAANKRDSADFVLWKPSSDEQPGWDSPWGRGRPGWHIECSAMSKRYLGEVFDIHGGGQDLIFPHHENEIAQSRCADGTERMARFWIHNGYLTVDGEKMSKSLGNYHTVHDLLSEAPGEAIRLSLLAGQYRQPLDFSREALRQAKAQLDRLYGALRTVGDVEPAAPDGPSAELLTALQDDMNTPLALSHLHELASRLNKSTDRAEQAMLKGQMLAGGALLGLVQGNPEAWFQSAAGAEDGLAPAQIEDLIARRQAARAGRDFAEADRIRAELAGKGVILEDGADGTTWRREA